MSDILLVVNKTDDNKVRARCPELSVDLLLSEFENKNGRLLATVQAIEWPDLTLATSRVDLLDVGSKYRYASRLAAKNSLTAALWQELLDEVTERAYEGVKAEGESSVEPSCRTWSHDDLLAAEFPEQKWIVQDFVPEASLVLLGGKKKLGKSWLALQLAQAVAYGAPFLQHPTIQGSVMYFCLEDGERRLAGRLKKQNAIRGLPIHYITGGFKPLDRGGLSELRALIVASNPCLVIIDTLAAAKTGQMDEDAAGDMGDLANALRELAQELKTAIVVVAHHGKRSYGDPGHDLRGSSALAAAADVNLGLYKTENGHLLKGEGRDIEEFELRISFDAAYTWCWQLVGDARQSAKEENEAEVLAALETLGEADAATVGKETGKSRVAAYQALRRLAQAGMCDVKTEKVGKTQKVIYVRKNGVSLTRVTPLTALTSLTPIAASNNVVHAVTRVTQFPNVSETVSDEVF